MAKTGAYATQAASSAEVAAQEDVRTNGEAQTPRAAAAGAAKADETRAALVVCGAKVARETGYLPPSEAVAEVW